MKLELTQAALADLRSIRRYTLSTWGPAQEQRYIDTLWKKFSAILTTPERYCFRNDLFPRCQIAAAGQHVVLFRVHAGVL